MTRPWETVGGSRAWEEGAIYPRTVSINRPIAPTTANIGAIGYQGLEQNSTLATGETVIATGLACGIQAGGIGKTGGLGITKSDSPGPVQWHVYFSNAVMSKGTLRDRDIIIDDESYRYQVAAAVWTILGYRADCIRLEA